MIQPASTGQAFSEPRPRKRRSRLEKGLLVFGIASTGIVLLCCVTSLFFLPDLITSPADVESIARKYGPLKIPEGFRGVIAASADNALVWLQFARFGHKEGRGKLVIGGIYFRRTEANPEREALAVEVDAYYYDMLLDKFVPKIRLLDVREKREKTVEIRGKSVTFEVVHGEDRASTTRFRQVTGEFPGPVGTANVLIQVEEGFITDQEIDDFLESLADLGVSQAPSAKSPSNGEPPQATP